MTDFYRASIESKTLGNTYYRKVLYTTEQTQLVVMCIPPGGSIPRERHRGTTQVIRLEAGRATVKIDGKTSRLKAGDIVIIPANTWHAVSNNGDEDLKLYTLYSPPEHAPGLRQKHQPGRA